MKLRRFCLLNKLVFIFLLFLILECVLFAYESLPYEDMQSYLIKNEAATLDLATRRAMLDAVKRSVSRFMASDKLIKAIQVLDGYLRKNIDQFIQTTTVVSKERRNEVWDADIRVIVNNKKLYDDLDKKGFIYKPRFFPKVLVIINETVDKRPSSSFYARKSIEEYIMNKGIDIVPSDEFAQVDFQKDKDRIVQYAQQMEAEIVILGNSTCSFKEKIDKGEKTNFLEPQFFFETTIELDVIRIDNDEIFLSRKGYASRSDRDRVEAIRKSIEQAATNCSENLYEEYYNKWQKEVLNQTDYQFILNDTNEEEINILVENLKRFDNTIEVYRRFYWHNVAVLNVDYSGDKGELLEYIKGIEYPAYKVFEPAQNIIDLYQTF